jgi:hypothetical protein
MRKVKLLLEFLAVFGGLPLLVLALRQRLVMALALWGCALAAWLLLRREACPESCAGGLRDGLRDIALRFACIAPLLCLCARLLEPERFLALPRERPLIWLAIMVGYPLLSVWPQELLFRRFAHSRYAPLFGEGAGFVIASGLAFGFAHVIYMNPVAVLLSAGGGFIFAAAYARHRSLRLVCLEHALYGCLIFSVGLERYFYTAAAWAA